MKIIIKIVLHLVLLLLLLYSYSYCWLLEGTPSLRQQYGSVIYWSSFVLVLLIVVELVIFVRFLISLIVR